MFLSKPTNDKLPTSLQEFVHPRALDYESALCQQLEIDPQAFPIDCLKDQALALKFTGRVRSPASSDGHVPHAGPSVDNFRASP